MRKGFNRHLKVGLKVIKGTVLSYTVRVYIQQREGLNLSVL